MLKAAIDRIVSLSAPNITEVNGEQYADKKLERIPRALRACPMEVHTLTAILDYITSGTDDNNEQTDINNRFVLHIADYDQVVLTRELDADRCREDLLIACDLNEKFPFGRWFSVEEFIIFVQSHFVMDDMVATLVKLVSSVTDSNSVHQSDNGLSQSVTARTGIVTQGKVEVPNPVTLRPLCTFSEIEQPARRFVFRLRPGRSDGDGVQAALFDADGTAWRREAILSIRDWFTDKLPEELRDEVIILA